MKTALDVRTELFKILNRSTALKSAITGGIYKGVRPANSVLEDVVVNTIVLGTGSRQRGVANVNIHVKDSEAGPVGAKYPVPNEARLTTLSNIVKSILDEGDGVDFSYFIESTNVIQQPEISQHYMNFRMSFTFVDPD